MSISNKVYNCLTNKNESTVTIDSDIFMFIIQELCDYHDLIMCYNKSPFLKDTTPNRLALSLVRQLGYNSTSEFFNTNEDYRLDD